MKIYGLRNCDTCRKAMKWLDQNDLAYGFVDLKTDIIPVEILDQLIVAYKSGDLNLINKSSTAWRELGDAQKDAVTAGDEKDLLNILQQSPNLIKRPLIDHAGIFSCGFKQDVQARLLTA